MGILRVVALGMWCNSDIRHTAIVCLYSWCGTAVVLCHSYTSIIVEMNEHFMETIVVSEGIIVVYCNGGMMGIWGFHGIQGIL